jgi:hypothetical protein
MAPLGTILGCLRDLRFWARISIWTTATRPSNHNTNPLLTRLISGRPSNSVQTPPRINSTPTRTICLAQASHALRYAYTYSEYYLELTYVINEIFLRQASDRALMAAQNPAYMRLFTENIKLRGSYETLEYAPPRPFTIYSP